MAPQTNKFNINPSASTPQKITILSPGVDDSSTMPKSIINFTPERITPKKKPLP